MLLAIKALRLCKVPELDLRLCKSSSERTGLTKDCLPRQPTFFCGGVVDGVRGDGLDWGGLDWAGLSVLCFSVQSWAALG